MVLKMAEYQSIYKFSFSLFGRYFLITTKYNPLVLIVSCCNN